jgi:hypothetical protein
MTGYIPRRERKRQTPVGPDVSGGFPVISYCIKVGYNLIIGDVFTPKRSPMVRSG